MTITCAIGIDLYNAYKNGGDPMAALCQLKGVEKPEQLSRAEIQELTKVSETFNKAVLTPKDVRDVKIEFTLGEYFVTLGKFLELDITLQAIELVEGFNPTEFERMPVMLGCIYAPMIKEIFKLTQPIANVAAEVSDAIRSQVAFEDVYAVFDFFVVWKESFTMALSPSMKLSMSNYRLRRRVQRPSRLLITRSLTVSPKKSGQLMRAIKRLIFIANILMAILSRWFWLMIASLRGWWLKKHNR